MKKLVKVFFSFEGILAAMSVIAGVFDWRCGKCTEAKTERGHGHIHKAYGCYEKYFKRTLDFFISATALIALSPCLLFLTVIGAFKMKGNPFFCQKRPGKDEKIFRIIKFRTMDNRKDERGVLLPDSERLNNYGRMLRNTSLDELPELINILLGDMSIVGPRPLLAEYLPYYTESEKCRHDVKPGLTGLAQVNGRNMLSWQDRFQYDVQYVENLSFLMDLKIIIITIKKVFLHSDILRDTSKKELNFAWERQNNMKVEQERQANGEKYE